MSHLNDLVVAAQTRFGDLRVRAEAESEQGEIVEKVIIVAAVAAMSIAAMAAIALAVSGKLGELHL